MAGRRWLVWVAAMAVLGGCGATGSGPGGDDLDRLRQQARDALSRYDKAVRDAGGAQSFVPVGELTSQLGDWEPANGDNNKQALLAGKIFPATALPTAGQPTGTVVWEKGRTQPVPLMSAEEALAQLRATGGGHCDCVPLEATAARLTTARIPTTRGPATAPAWEYTLRGTAVRLTRIAVAPAAAIVVTPPAWGPEYPHGGLAIESATGTTTSRRLTVAFTGSPGPGSQPCGADYSAEAAESVNALVVIVIEQRHADGAACGDVGARRTATVDLAQPLGSGRSLRCGRACRSR
ncbi:hypothetical protein DKT69_23290 [Micromonospora sicca]|uniref:Uncharacterized protein n=1 Tax=Micromonospora sicca TaxID=2202420 RepID=A0A317DEF4_9ACTN|nr:hypothetical protein [Micromonospora sp. 4G51]PWR12682.1 hypothetical protein DKT69_23290 [Micromonospora sp. 4G51]